MSCLHLYLSVKLNRRNGCLTVKKTKCHWLHRIQSYSYFQLIDWKSQLIVVLLSSSGWGPPSSFLSRSWGTLPVLPFTRMAICILSYWRQDLQIQPVTVSREWFPCPLQAQLGRQQKPSLQPLLAPRCSRVSSSTLRANGLTTCLFSTVSIAQVSPSCSIAVFSFVPSRAIGCSFPANLILLFPGSLTGPCRFLHTFLLSLAWVTSAIQQV